MNNMFKQMQKASDETDLTGKLEIDEKLQKALLQDSVDSSVVLEELKALDDNVLNHSKHTFRVRLARVLESTPLEIFLVVLVIVDVIILMIMLLLDLNILHLYLEDSNHAAKLLTDALGGNCMGNPDLQHYDVPKPNLVTVTGFLEHDGCMWDAHHSNDTDIYTANNDHRRRKRSAGPAQEGENPLIPVLLEVGHVLHIMSVVILAIMVVEVVLKIFAMGVKYFKGKLEVIDGIVIVISFAMDLYFIDGISASGVNNGATILVIFLLWRILRVFNALLVTAKKRLQFRIRVQKRMRKLLEDKMEVFEDDIKNLEDYVENLNRLAKRHSLPDYEIKACKPLVRQMKRANTSAGLASMMQMSMGLMHGMNNMKPVEKPRSAIADSLRNPPPKQEEEKLAETVSEILTNATSASEKANQLVDVVNDTSNSILPVPVITAIATGSREGTPQPARSASGPTDGKHVPNSVGFATAVATGKQNNFSMANGAALRNWNDTPNNGNNNAKQRSEV